MQMTDYPIYLKWENGGQIPINGKIFTLKVKYEEHRTSDRIQLVDQEIMLTTSYLVSDSIRESVVFWYRKACKGIIVARVDFYAPILAVHYNRIVLKEQKTCWGSCSSKLNLNFNWKLLLMPPEVMDYVIVHELSHLLEMNHSKNFWKVVEKVMPDYKIHRKWLKENGMEYMKM